MLDVRIGDAKTANVAKVSNNGELIVARVQYSDPYYVALDVDDQIFNVVPAITGKRFVLSGMIVSANRNVNGESVINVYQALSDSATTDGELLTLTVAKSVTVPLTGLDFVTKSTRWINATCDDNTVDLTVVGFYID